MTQKFTLNSIVSVTPKQVAQKEAKEASFIQQYAGRLVDAIMNAPSVFDGEGRTPKILVFLQQERFIYSWTNYNGRHFWNDPAQAIYDSLGYFNAGGALTLRSNRSSVFFLFTTTKNSKTVLHFAELVARQVFYGTPALRRRFYKALRDAEATRSSP